MGIRGGYTTAYDCVINSVLLNDVSPQSASQSVSGVVVMVQGMSYPEACPEGGIEQAFDEPVFVRTGVRRGVIHRLGTTTEGGQSQCRRGVSPETFRNGRRRVGGSAKLFEVPHSLERFIQSQVD